MHDAFAAEEEMGDWEAVLCWHGTPQSNVDPILRYGLDSRKRGSHRGQVLGPGEYFAATLAHALAYCSDGRAVVEKQVLLFRVLVRREHIHQKALPVGDVFVVDHPRRRLPLAVLHLDLHTASVIEGQFASWRRASAATLAAANVRASLSEQERRRALFERQALSDQESRRAEARIQTCLAHGDLGEASNIYKRIECVREGGRPPWAASVALRLEQLGHERGVILAEFPGAIEQLEEDFRGAEPHADLPDQPGDVAAASRRPCAQPCMRACYFCFCQRRFEADDASPAAASSSHGNGGVMAGPSTAPTGAAQREPVTQVFASLDNFPQRGLQVACYEVPPGMVGEVDINISEVNEVIGALRLVLGTTQTLAAGHAGNGDVSSSERAGLANGGDATADGSSSPTQADVTWLALATVYDVLLASVSTRFHLGHLARICATEWQQKRDPFFDHPIRLWGSAAGYRRDANAHLAFLVMAASQSQAPPQAADAEPACIQGPVLAIAEINSSELRRLGLYNPREGACVSLPLTARASSLDVVGAPPYRRPQLHLQIHTGYANRAQAVWPTARLSTTS
jgi:hypothetical protein